MRYIFTAITLLFTLSSNASYQDKNWGLYDIKVWEALKYFKPKKTIYIAIIDSGVDCSHKNIKCSFVGWDFVDNHSASNNDFEGHGTHVAGIIQSINSNTVIVPIKYYANATSGKSNLSNFIKSIKFAVKTKVDIINLSGGGPTYSKEEYEALEEAKKAGILVVTAAGNEHHNTEIEAFKFYPASYVLGNLISVAATNVQEKLIPESNYGNNIDFAAPGYDIYSTLPHGEYGYMSGTSQATAFVTGVASLILGSHPKLKPYEVKFLLAKTATSNSSLKNKLRFGKIDAEKAVKESYK